jgi:enoyl-CoA hydratase/carnithine racemase
MSLVLTERRGPAAHLILNRPERKNALDQALMDALAAALDAVRDDPAVKVLVLRGAGGVFSSGIDHALLMEVFQKSQQVPFRHVHRDLQAVMDRLEAMERPVIAVLSRYCVGMALELALACDLRVATADCVLGLPEVAFGIIPDVGGTTRLVRTVGLQRAREMILTGRLVTARRARADQLVTQVAPDEAAALAAADALAEHLAAFPAAGVGLAKAMVLRAADLDRESSLRLEGWVQSILLRQPDVGSAFADALGYIKRQLEAPEDL